MRGESDFRDLGGTADERVIEFTNGNGSFTNPTLGEGADVDVDACRGNGLDG